MSDGLLTNERALITGAGSGIGRGIAVALAAEGARVAVSDLPALREATLAAVPGAVFIPADLTDRAAPAALFAAAEEALGGVSILVHSAAPRRLERQTALAVTEAEWDAMIDVNLRAGFMLGQMAGRAMRAAGVRGKMLFLTSLHAESPRNLPHYSAAKAGLTMLTKELARALAPDGIRVNAIAPGAIPGGGFVADVEAFARMIPMRRPGTAEDIAGMAVALLCDRFSGYVTGTTVAVDGGLGLFNWIPAAG